METMTIIFEKLSLLNVANVTLTLRRFSAHHEYAQPGRGGSLRAVRQDGEEQVVHAQAQRHASRSAAQEVQEDEETRLQQRRLDQSVTSVNGVTHCETLKF